MTAARGPPSNRSTRSSRTKLRVIAGLGVILAGAYIVGGVLGIPIWKPNPIYVNAQNYSVQPQVTTNLPNLPNVTIGTPSWDTSAVSCGATGTMTLSPTTPAGADGAVLGVTTMTKCSPADFMVAVGTTPAATLTSGLDTVTLTTTWNAGANSATMVEKITVTGGTLTTGTYVDILIDYGSPPSEVDTLTVSITGT